LISPRLAGKDWIPEIAGRRYCAANPINSSGAMANQPQIATFDPAELLQLVAEQLSYQRAEVVCLRAIAQHADAPHPFPLLRPRRQRPRRRRANPRDEVAPSHTHPLSPSSACGAGLVRGRSPRVYACGTGPLPGLLPQAGEGILLATLHSITSSARRRKDSEIVSPMAFAVLRLTTSSNLVGN